MIYLVTGAAGFIGNHVALRLCQLGYQVVGVDNLNHYYDVTLKHDRLQRLLPLANFTFIQLDIADSAALAALFERYRFTIVIHLAAQAGVRYSLENPMAYADSNLVGHLSVLEACRRYPVAHLVYASSSSVYGKNSRLPFSERDTCQQPASLYAATKIANEAMSYSYAALYQLPVTGLRFFTVYGPWGRPDMALFKFTEAIFQNRPIDLYNQGALSRDFTYIDDIVEGILRVQAQIPGRADGDTTSVPSRLYNIGYGKPVPLLQFVQALEQSIGKTALKNMLPMQPGDVEKTWADNRLLFQAVGYRPQVALAQGVQRFVDWYRDYYQLSAYQLSAYQLSAGESNVQLAANNAGDETYQSVASGFGNRDHQG